MSRLDSLDTIYIELNSSITNVSKPKHWCPRWDLGQAKYLYSRSTIYPSYYSLKNPFSCSYKGLTLLADVFHYAVFGHKLQWIFYFLKCTVCKWEGRVYQIYAFIYKKKILYKITNDITCI